MKRFLSLMAIVCAICCHSAYAQEAEPVNNYPQFSVAARFDYPVLPYLYTFLEGNIGDYLSYSVSNHWVSDATSDLYRNTFQAAELDWCDWAYLTFSTGNWSISAGKDMIAMGTFEEDAYDVDSYAELNTQFWNNAQIYQWGAKANYTTDSGNTDLAFQFASSPFDEKPFQNGLKTLSLYLNGTYGIFRPIWSLNNIQYGTGKGESITMFASGNQFDVADWAILGLDYILRSDGGHVGHDIAVSADFFLGDRFELLLKGGFDSGCAGKLGLDAFGIAGEHSFGGLCFQYYPLKGSQDLRFHALAGMEKFAGEDLGYLLNAGVTYNLNLSNLLFNR